MLLNILKQLINLPCFHILSLCVTLYATKVSMLGSILCYGSSPCYGCVCLQNIQYTIVQPSKMSLLYITEFGLF